ncbi:MAG: nucleotidyltransferase family protein [Elusimicrobiota bacterium]|jgi:NDP-sugar pyrophosphorylase family protein
MVLAAGIGSRLRPLTDQTPKALVEVAGVPMLEIVLRRLIKAGAEGIIVNTFHLAEPVESFLRARDWGVPIAISREDELLDTGGGLKKAAPFFTDSRPFFLHNADVFSDLDLGRLYRRHVESGALATLAVSERQTERYFLFDPAGRLCGWESTREDRVQWAGAPAPQAQRLAFNGIHVISPKIFPLLTESGVFSINRSYLRLAGQAAHIGAFRMDEYYYKDIGSAAKLEEVRARASSHGLPL